jgi:putative membrane protein
MMPWYGIVFGPIMMIIWLVVLIVVAAAVIRWLQGGTAVPLLFMGNRKRALEILEERFAKGEIDKDESKRRSGCSLTDPADPVREEFRHDRQKH